MRIPWICLPIVGLPRWALICCIPSFWAPVRSPPPGSKREEVHFVKASPINQWSVGVKSFVFDHERVLNCRYDKNAFFPWRCSSYWTVSNLLFKAKYVKKWEFSFLFIHSFECKRRVGKTFLFTRTGPFLQSCNDGYRWHLASKIFILHISSLLASLFRPNVKYCTAISPKVLWPLQKSSQDNKPKVAVHERNKIFQTQSNKSTCTQRKDRVHNDEEEN